MKLAKVWLVVLLIASDPVIETLLMSFPSGA
jgi:hypothetical protein